MKTPEYNSKKLKKIKAKCTHRMFEINDENFCLTMTDDEVVVVSKNSSTGGSKKNYCFLTNTPKRLKKKVKH